MEKSKPEEALLPYAASGRIVLPGSVLAGRDMCDSRSSDIPSLGSAKRAQSSDKEAHLMSNPRD